MTVLFTRDKTMSRNAFAAVFAPDVHARDDTNPSCDTLWGSGPGY